MIVPAARKKFRKGPGFTRMFAALAVIAASVPAAFGQLQAPPPGGTPRPFVFPTKQVYQLANGMNVTLVRYGSAPKVAVKAVVRAGALDERPDQRWISDMVATLLPDGTAAMNSEQIAREIADMGGSLSSSASTDKTVVEGEVLSEFDSRFINMLSDVLLNPAFDPAGFERARANKIRELSTTRSDATTAAWERLRGTIFPGHAYGTIYPTEALLRSYTLQNAKAFYYNQFGAARTHLYVVGQFDESSVKKVIESRFGRWKKGPDPIRSVPGLNPRRTMEIIDRPGAVESTIYLGMPAASPSDDDYIGFTVMDALLGGSFSSRIASNIGEDKAYANFTASSIWTRYKIGYWYQNATVATEATGASIREILSEIDRLRKGPPTVAELQGIKDYLIGRHVLQNSSRTGVIAQLENVDDNELPSGYLESYPSKIAAVTPERVSEITRKYLQRDKMTIVVVGDKSKIAGQLRPFELSSDR
jgi:predicted Zn-dependent peptidase